MPLSSPLRLVQRFRRNSTSGPLQLYETDDDQKLDLLEDAIEDSTNTEFDANVALARLKRLYPLAKDEFRSKQQALENAPLRLLCKPHAKTQSAKEAPYFQSFVAVSYCWRDGNWDTASHLSVPADDMPVSPEMIKAVLSKTHRDEGIWIDQCCMDHSDNAERSAVIGITDLIYKGAREVYVLLEDIAISAPEMQVLDDFVEFGFKVFGTDSDKEYCLAAIEKIASARWFQRAWGFHEMQCHESCIFVISGPKVMFYRHSEWLVELVAHFNASKRSRATLSGMRKMVGEAGSLSRKFAIVNSLTCAIPADKIAMCLSLSHLQLYYVGKTKSQDECRWLLHVLALAGGDAIELLSLAWQRSPYQSSAQKPSTSSVSLVSTMPKSNPFTWCNSMDDEDGIVSASPKDLELTVYCPPQWITRSPTIAILTRANEFTRLAMGDHSKTSFSTGASVSASTITLAPRSETGILSQIIASSFECGLGWIVSQAHGINSVNREFGRQVEDSPESATLFDRLLESGLLTYQQLLELTERNRRAVTLYVYFLVFGSPLAWMQPHDSSVASSIDNYYHVNTAEHGLPMQCWIVETRGRKPFLLIEPDEIPKHELMVLPIALGNSTCVSLPRLWYLQSTLGSKGKNWEVVSRSYIFSFDQLESILGPVDQNMTTKDVNIKLG